MALNSRVKVPMPKKGVVVRGSGTRRYVYHVTRTYRNAKGQPTCDRRSIGRLDEGSGMLIPNDAYYEFYGDTHASVEVLPAPDAVKSIGASFLVERILSDLGVETMLGEVLGRPDARACLISASYMACRGNVMDHAADWCEECMLSGEVVTSQSTSALFSRIGHEQRMAFFRLWVATRAQSEYLAYDVTSVSSYAKGVEGTEWGYNRDGERLPQVNMAMYLGQTSRLPVFYCTYPGSIVDKSLLPYMMAYNADLGIRGVSFVMDRGFCTTSNVAFMAERHYAFVMGVDVRHKATRGAVDAVRDTVVSMRNLAAKGVYAQSVRDRFYGTASTMHVFFDPVLAEHQRQDLLRRVEADEEALCQMTSLSDRDRKRYSRHFRIEAAADGAFSFERDFALIDASAANSGFFCILTNDAALTSEEVLRIYRDKDSVEKGFDDLKNHLDMGRLRTHVTETTDGKVFCAFISLIAVFHIQDRLGAWMREKCMSKAGVIAELEKIKVVTVAGGKRLMNPLTKTQKDMLAAFDITEDDVKAYVTPAASAGA